MKPAAQANLGRPRRAWQLTSLSNERDRPALSLPKAPGGVLAVLISAVLFSWHHHLGEPFEMGVFLFRTMAGVILGFLFWFRGFGVCVYTHAMYDVYYFLSHHQP